MMFDVGRVRGWTMSAASPVEVPEWTVDPIRWLSGSVVRMLSRLAEPALNAAADVLRVVSATPERALLFGILVTLVLILLTLWNVRVRVVRARRCVFRTARRLRHRFRRFVADRP